MKAVIPVAGIGTRLRPHTYSIHKVLLNVAGKPILDHIIDELINAGINEIVFIKGYLGEQIEEHIKTTYVNNNADFKAYFVEQKIQQGIADAVYLAKEFFEENEEIVIVLGDTIFKTDFKAIVSDPESILCVKKVDDPRRFGVVVEKNGYATKLVEKPEDNISKLALVGLYKIKNSNLLWKVISEMFEKNIRTKNEYQITDALEMMIQREEKMKVMEIENWYDCGKSESLLETNRILLDNRRISTKTEGCVIIDPVFIDEKAEVKNSIIGPYVTIAAGAKLSSCRLKNSIIGYNATVDKMIAENSIVGNNARITGTSHTLNIGDSTEVKL